MITSDWEAEIKNFCETEIDLFHSNTNVPNIAELHTLSS